MTTIRQRIEAALAADIPVSDRDLGKYVDRSRFPDVATARQAAQRRARGRAVHGIKARTLKDQFDSHPGRNLDGNLKITHRGKTVTISRVEVEEFEDGNSCVLVWTGGVTGPPNFRIFNPPMLARDPRGEVSVEQVDGRVERFREDPVAALAEVLADQGGAR